MRRSSGRAEAEACVAVLGRRAVDNVRKALKNSRLGTLVRAFLATAATPVVPDRSISRNANTRSWWQTADSVVGEPVAIDPARELHAAVVNPAWRGSHRRRNWRRSLDGPESVHDAPCRIDDGGM